MCDTPVGLLPQLGAGRLVVRARIIRIRILIGLPCTGDLASKPITHAVVTARIIGLDSRGAFDHLGTVGAQHILFVLAHLVGAYKNALVSALLGHHRQPHTGIAAGGFHDRAPGRQQTLLFGGVDHPGGDPVLHGAAGIEVLHLRVHRTGQPLGNLA